MMRVVSVNDRAMGAFSRPYFVPSVGVAVRQFTDEVNRKADDNPMWRHPEDYELWYLGEFTEESGEFSVKEEKRLLVRAKDVFKE